MFFLFFLFHSLFTMRQPITDILHVSAFVLLGIPQFQLRRVASVHNNKYFWISPHGLRLFSLLIISFVF